MKTRMPVGKDSSARKGDRRDSYSYQAKQKRIGRAIGSFKNRRQKRITW
jgi:hypothetical protein